MIPLHRYAENHLGNQLYKSSHKNTTNSTLDLQNNIS